MERRKKSLILVAFTLISFAIFIIAINVENAIIALIGLLSGVFGVILCFIEIRNRTVQDNVRIGVEAALKNMQNEK